MRRTRFNWNHRSRRGWMLIELLVALTIVGIAAGTASFLIVKMIRVSQIQADALVRERTLHQWADQFRQDGRSARTAQVVNRSIQFHQVDAVVTYSPLPTGLERRVDDRLAGRWTSRGDWSFALDESGRIAKAELISSSELSTSEGLPKGQRVLPRHLRIRIETAVGRAP